MKKSPPKITLRPNEIERKMLEDLTLKTGLSINRTLLDLVEKSTEKNVLKGELMAINDQLKTLTETSRKQNNVLVDLVRSLQQKGVV